ncbi:MAG: MtrAB system histidine kinase MtrB [Streptosporangiaceae bacterium]|jgi:two-component system sensor histidine kinase MtrB
MRGVISRTAGSGRRLAGLGNGKQGQAALSTAARPADETGLDANAMMTPGSPAADLHEAAGAAGHWSVTVHADRIRRALRPASRLSAALRKRLVAAAGSLREHWVRSLQLRVVGTTLVLSGAVVTVLGLFLMQYIASDVLQADATRTGSVAAEGLQTAEAMPWVRSSPGSGTRGQIYQLLHQLQVQAPGLGNYGMAVLIAQPRQEYAALTAGGRLGIPSAQSLPTPLTDKVSQLQGHGIQNKLSYQLTSINNYPGSGAPVTTGFAYGVPLGNYYQLYYFFPLSDEQRSLDQVQLIMMLAGLALVVLLALIASLVTRWVVVPVRQAASGAQRLRAGNLQERMAVRGSDELAALATSFNEMAASLQDKMQQLEDLTLGQRQFVSDVSHELRTPLTTIKCAAEVIFASRAELDPAAARSAELLLSQLERFESLLADLLEISKHDANVATLDPEPVDVCDLVRNAADVAQQLAERRGAKIEFRLPAEPCVAEVDPRRVERIMRNLLVNAVEHGDGKGTLVTVAGDSGAVAVAVRDHGVGLRPGEEHLVFDRFWRADPARARSTGGTGLGLSIALEDARLHGGWLEAWGECGRGSLFRLTLPRAAGALLEGSPLSLIPDEAELADGAAGLAGLPLDGEGGGAAGLAGLPLDGDGKAGPGSLPLDGHDIEAGAGSAPGTGAVPDE